MRICDPGKLSPAMATYIQKLSNGCTTVTETGLTFSGKIFTVFMLNGHILYCQEKIRQLVAIKAPKLPQEIKYDCRVQLAECKDSEWGTPDSMDKLLSMFDDNLLDCVGLVTIIHPRQVISVGHRPFKVIQPYGIEIVRLCSSAWRTRTIGSDPQLPRPAPYLWPRDVSAAITEIPRAGIG